jgi:hypothetical protein
MRSGGRLGHPAICVPAIQRDHAPSHVDVANALRGSEEMRADRTIGILDCDGTLQDGLKSLPDV